MARTYLRRQLPTIARRECNGCTLCCTVLGIKEIDKPRDTPCEFLNNAPIGGCSIYSERPTSCREFECVWALGGIPETLWPHETRVVVSDLKVVDNRTVIYLNVHPDDRGAEQRGEWGRYLPHLIQAGILVVVLCGREQTVLGQGADDYIIDPLDD